MNPLHILRARRARRDARTLAALDFPASLPCEFEGCTTLASSIAWTRCCNRDVVGNAMCGEHAVRLLDPSQGLLHLVVRVEAVSS